MNHTEMNHTINAEEPFDNKKRLWMLLFILIAAMTIYAVMSHSEVFTMSSFRDYLTNASKPLLLVALLAAFGFTFFEGAALAAILRAFDCKLKVRRWLTYAASNIYFSAITPSASGGQPACAYFMIKDGIPASITTIALLTNLTMYTISILLIGLFTLIIMPNIFLSFGLVSRILIIAGSVIQIVLAGFFFMLLIKSTLLHGICRKVLCFLAKIGLLKNEQEKQLKLDRYMAEYAMCAEMIKKRKKAMILPLLLNILQRASVISVSLFVFLATGGSPAASSNIWAVQICSIVGSNPVPIPGAMGVSDYIMLDGFGNIIPYSSAVNLELLSRSLSFYISVLVSGLVVLIKYLKMRKKAGKS